MKILLSISFLLLFSCSEIIEEKARENPLDDDSIIDLNINILNIFDNDSLQFGDTLKLEASKLFGSNDIDYSDLVENYKWQLLGNSFSTDSKIINKKIDKLGDQELTLTAVLKNGDTVEKNISIYIYPIKTKFKIYDFNVNNTFNYGENIIFTFEMLDLDNKPIKNIKKIQWFSSLDREIHKTNGLYTKNDLRAGKHVISVHVTLEDDVIRTERTNVIINPIHFEILTVSPSDNSEFDYNDQITFNVTYNLEYDTEPEVSWISDKYGEIGTGHSLMKQIEIDEQAISLQIKLEDKTIHRRNINLEIKYPGILNTENKISNGKIIEMNKKTHFVGQLNGDSDKKLYEINGDNTLSYLMTPYQGYYLIRPFDDYFIVLSRNVGNQATRITKYDYSYSQIWEVVYDLSHARGAYGKNIVLNEIDNNLLIYSKFQLIRLDENGDLIWKKDNAFYHNTDFLITEGKIYYTATTDIHNYYYIIDYNTANEINVTSEGYTNTGSSKYFLDDDVLTIELINGIRIKTFNLNGDLLTNRKLYSNSKYWSFRHFEKYSNDLYRIAAYHSNTYSSSIFEFSQSEINQEYQFDNIEIVCKSDITYSGSKNNKAYIFSFDGSINWSQLFETKKTSKINLISKQNSNYSAYLIYNEFLWKIDFDENGNILNYN